MNLLDYVLALILGYCLVRGVFRGMVKELSAIVGVLGGFYAAYSYYPRLAKPISRWIAGGGYENIIAFLIIFTGIYLAVSILGVILKYLMNIAFLGWTDRFCGALFGACKGLLIVAVISAMLTTFLAKNAAVLSESLLVRRTMVVSESLVHVASANMKSLFESHLKELKKTWRTQTK
ncbi:MAG: CvpA family protein [Desulfatitalea sp.]|nr:CvpA family protein [Desulfatitalea sp.]NNJ99628.1 CvpA family protein [Desulfatitalea sp.]